MKMISLRKWTVLPLLVLSCWIGVCSASAQGFGKPAASAENAQTNPPPPASESPGQFVFNGGTLAEFIDALDKHFHVNIRERATITVPMQTMVPKIRVNVAGYAPPVINVLMSYNGLSNNGFQELGRWYWPGTPGGPIPNSATDGLPYILALTGGSTNSLNAVKLRAFSMDELNPSQREKLMQTIDEAFSILAKSQERSYRSFGGSESGVGMRFSPGTDLLLVWASEPYLDAAEAVIKEYRQAHPAKPRF